MNPFASSTDAPTSVLLNAALLIVALLAICGCNSSNTDATSSNAPNPQAPVVTKKTSSSAVDEAAAERKVESPIRFVDRTSSSGIDFTYYGGPTSQRFMTEQNGGGIALFDFDLDGWPDVFLSNGSLCDRTASGIHSQRLYRALGNFQFEDRTSPAQLTAYGFGQGCAAGDLNNDGFVDLFVGGYRQNWLWLNLGDGTFQDVTEAAGVSDDQWSTSPAFADLDADGDLDLFVVTYVDWNCSEPPCYSQHNPPVRISCTPTNRAGQPDRLFQNLGDGRFLECGRDAGVDLPEQGKGLALAIADWNDDDRLDVYVANDATPNYLFQNMGKCRFEETAVVRGVAVSGDGSAGASMGVATGDYNRDGRFDLFVTNFLNQPNDAFENLGPAGFNAVNRPLGIDVASRPMLGFGIVQSDFDADGWPDLFVANGHIWDFTQLGLGYTYRMPQQVFWNRAGRRFENVTIVTGDYFQKPHLGRALAVADLDRDGDLDAVIGQVEERTSVLENVSSRFGRVASLKLIGRNASRQPLGIRVDYIIEGQSFSTVIPSGGSFQSSHDDVLILPLLNASKLKQLKIHWGPSNTETWTDIPIGGEIVVIEGERPQVRQPF